MLPPSPTQPNNFGVDFKLFPNNPTVQNFTNLTQLTPSNYNQDVVNIPPALVGTDGMPILGADGIPVTPGEQGQRSEFDGLDRC
ncbi:MAG: hypothetical protein EXQ69_00835 [Acidimicrobiia bacterium]|nr:hypothetical protein [Acidimicrobiia bacterium]